MKLKDLAKNLKPLSVRGNTEIEIKGIASHSQKIQPGYLFIAIPGKYFDGADFISEAKDRGAVGLVVKEFFAPINSSMAQIKVKNPRKALAYLSNEFFGQPARQVKMIGVTGTNGKTTVATLARAILEAEGISTGLLGTINYQMGERCLPSELTTPAPPRLQLLLEEIRKAGCSHVIMEVSSHALKQERVTGIEFQTALFTNLSREHLDYHRTLKNYRDSKMRMFENLHRGVIDPLSKIAIVNYDDPLSRRIQSRLQTPILTYGLQTPADLRATDIRLSEEGCSFRLSWKQASYPAHIHLLGRHNVYNALAAIALGLSEGISLEKIIASLETIRVIAGRLEPVRAGQNFHVLVDFAHTPDALENVLQAVREIYRKRIIIVFGCGGDRDRSKRPLMGRAARRADSVIATSDNPRSEEPEKIIEDILSGLPRKNKKFQVIPDRRQAIEKAFFLARPGDVVLIAGKGHEQQQIFRDRIIPFNDREVALDILKEKWSSGVLE